MTYDKRLWLICGLTILAVFAVMMIGPVRQEEDYHNFADKRALLSIPNFFNVVSNLPFVIIGLLGLNQCFNALAGIDASRKPLIMIYRAFFSGVLLIGFGSAYYHFHPDNSGLLWDRLPMSISFTAFFCAVIGECIAPKPAQLLFTPLVLTGLVSVIYWYFTEICGQGDLRPYLLIQFLPMALIPLIYWLFDGKGKDCAFVWPVLGAYFLAKIAESMDFRLYIWLNFSGHSLKHLLASIGIYFVYAHISQPNPINNP